MKKLPASLSRQEFFRGLGMLFFQQLVLPSLLYNLAILLRLRPTNAEINFAFFLINYLCIGFLMRKFLSAELDVALGCIGKTFTSAALGFFVYTFLSSIISQWILFFDPEFANLNDAYVSAMSEKQFALIAVGTVILVPPAEELLFRGVLFNRLYHKRPVLSICLSAALFSVAHLLGYIDQYTPLQFMLAFFQYVPAGLALCFAYIRSGTIFAPILLHTFINGIAMYYQFISR